MTFDERCDEAILAESGVDLVAASIPLVSRHKYTPGERAYRTQLRILRRSERRIRQEIGIVGPLRMRSNLGETV